MIKRDGTLQRPCFFEGHARRLMQGAIYTYMK